MQPLPRLASVALAARCAELLAPSLGEFWQDGPEAERTLIQAAIRGAVQTAETGRAPDTLAPLANDVTRLVGKLVLHLHGIAVAETELPQTLASLPEARIRIIRTIIDVAARAARAATASSADGAFSECRDGVSWSYSVAEELGDSGLMDELSTSIDSLYAFCDREQLSDESTLRWTGLRWSKN